MERKRSFPESVLCEIVRQRIEEALEGMNYEKKKAAG